MKENKLEYKIDELAKTCELEEVMTNQCYSGLACLLNQIFKKFVEAIKKNKFREITDFEEGEYNLYYSIIKGKVVELSCCYGLDLASDEDEFYRIPTSIRFYSKDNSAVQAIYKIFKNFIKKQNLKQLITQAEKDIQETNNLFDGWVSVDFSFEKYLKMKERKKERKNERKNKTRS